MPIRNFRHKGLEDLFYDGTSAAIDARWQPKLIRLMDHLNAASEVKDLNISGFHPLKGDRKGRFAWKVTGNWRLTFRFADGDAFDLDLEDYH